MSTIIADNLTGKTAAGNVTVTSEGGAATFQLQQGLAKAWSSFTGTGTPTISDSLNGSSITDGGTGNYTFNMSNSMGNSTYGFLGYCRADGTSSTTNYALTSDVSDTKTASAFQVRTRYASSASSGVYDAPEICCEINGDLA